MNALQELRDSGFTVELMNAEQVRIKPQCPADWLPRLTAAKPEIIRALMAEKTPLYAIKTSPQLRGLAIIPDDRKFIEACVQHVRPEEINALLSEYRRRWLEAAEAVSKRHCKANAGRLAANSWLRVHGAK